MGSSFVLAFALAVGLGTVAAQDPNSRLDMRTPLVLRRRVGADLLAGAGPDPGFRRPARLAAGEWHRHRGAGDIADRVRHLILPVATLTLANLGGYTRYVRAAMREALGQDYIRTARAKGASEARVVFRHALRNALIPVTTILALSFGGLFSGALVTETMFAYPGMGKLIYDAVWATTTTSPWPRCCSPTVTDARQPRRRHRLWLARSADHLPLRRVGGRDRRWRCAVFAALCRRGRALWPRTGPGCNNVDLLTGWRSRRLPIRSGPTNSGVTFCCGCSTAAGLADDRDRRGFDGGGARHRDRPCRGLSRRLGRRVLMRMTDGGHRAAVAAALDRVRRARSRKVGRSRWLARSDAISLFRIVALVGW